MKETITKVVGTKELVTFVQFLYPGLVMSETSCREVKNRNKPRNIPRTAYAYRFYNKVKYVMGSDKKVFWGSPTNYSGCFYPEGKIYTLNQVKKKFPGDRILISNMEINKFNKVVETRMGNFQPFNKDDKVV